MDYESLITESMRDISKDSKEMLERLVRIEEKIIPLFEYKTDCEKDRSDHENRIASLEKWKSRQAGQINGVVASAMFFGGVVGAFLHASEFVKGLFR